MVVNKMSIVPALRYALDWSVQVWKLTYEQFLVGTELLVVPVLDRGATSVAVYLPATEAGEKWRHVWSGKVWAASQAGKVLHVEAPMGQPAVFVKVGSSVGDQFEENLRLKQLV
jgi:alpha-glucosidase (family GH31 glycosyl hydrolase)